MRRGWKVSGQTNELEAILHTDLRATDTLAA